MTDDEKLDHTAISKGKYFARKLTPSEIAEMDPGYLVCAYKEWDRPPCSKLLYDECVKDVAEARNRTGTESYRRATETD